MLLTIRKAVSYPGQSRLRSQVVSLNPYWLIVHLRPSSVKKLQVVQGLNVTKYVLVPGI